MMEWESHNRYSRPIVSAPLARRFEKKRREQATDPVRLLVKVDPIVEPHSDPGLDERGFVAFFPRKRGGSQICAGWEHFDSRNFGNKSHWEGAASCNAGRTRLTLLQKEDRMRT